MSPVPNLLSDNKGVSIYNCPFIVRRYHNKYCGKKTFRTVMTKEVCVFYLCDGIMRCTQLTRKEKEAFLRKKIDWFL